MVPMPGVATENFFGSAATSVSRSFIDFAATVGCTVNTLGEAATFDTGAKLLYGS